MPSISTIEADEIIKNLPNRLWRLENLYYIRDKKGRKVKFKLNWAQRELLQNLHNQNIVLKVRQIGCTTFSSILFLDHCFWCSNIASGIIADKRESSEEIFYSKVKYALDNMPSWCKDFNQSTNDNARELRFSNGSSYRVSTGLRSGTLQNLHISEFGKICSNHPDTAREIVTGSLNTVAHDQLVIIESTAEGRGGYFYDYCQIAQALKDTGKTLSPMEMKFFFFPWYKHPEYQMSEPVLIDRDLSDYFDKLEQTLGIELSNEQKHWYAGKKAMLGEDINREYPSTPQEAFESANAGLIWGDAIAKARKEKRICYLPYDQNALVSVSFDIGIRDATALWFIQRVGKELHCIDYYENNGEGLAHYINVIKRKPYLYDSVFVPHDAAAREKGTGKSYVDIGRELGLEMTVLPRDRNELFGIEDVRAALPFCFFDEQNCAKGIKALENFRKEWNEVLGVYRDKPLHDWASHGAKSFVYAIQGLNTIGQTNTWTADRIRQIREESFF